MLVLSRKRHETIVVGQDIEVTVLEIRGRSRKARVPWTGRNTDSSG